MSQLFKTSDKVTILSDNGQPLVKGAIVRSYKTDTGEYYLTKRDEEGGLQVYFAREENLKKENVSDRQQVFYQ